MRDFVLRLGPAPRFRFRVGHYGVFAPFAALFGMVFLLLAVSWYMVKATVFTLVLMAQLIARLADRSARCAERSSKD